ncbi:cytochrome P450 [Mycena filopes]|nr:cytochrome P450 [Mycena filopes]
MSSPGPPQLVLCVIAATALLLRYCYSSYWRLARSKLPLPPGPPKLPIVGNLFDIPPAFEWETYAEWGRKYRGPRFYSFASSTEQRSQDSDIIHLNLAGQSLVVLLSHDATVDLLEKRSSLYSDRPRLTMYFDLVGWDFNFALMGYGNKWRAHRRLFNQRFNPTALSKFRPHELAVTHRLLGRLLNTPDNFEQHLSQMTGELIISITYGINPLPVDDPYIALAERGVASGTDSIIPGKFLVDTFPLLKYVPDWFPGAGFKRQAKAWRKIAEDFRDVPFDEVKHQVASGTAPESFTADSLRAGTEAPGQEDVIKGTAASVYLAGTHPALAAFKTFFLAMLTNPDAQRQAQVEIDEVTRSARLPDFADEDAMPYVSALVKEVLRWSPVAPIALPHVLGADDEYRGYHLPANSIVIGNIWAILHDEVMYPDPHAFKPDRFLLNGKPNPNVRDPQTVFGFGRRICPGRHLAKSTLFIAVASILSSFDIIKAVDTDGQPIEPTFEFSSHLINAPLPFKCSILPRSKNAAALIQAIDSL